MRHGERDESPEVPAAGASRWRSLTLRYGVAVASVAVSFVGARLAEPLIVRWEILFLLYFGPVMLAAWHGGLGPGLLATGVIAGAIAYDGQPLSGSIGMAGAHQMALLTLFAAEAGLLAYLTHRARQATDGLRRYRAAREANRLKDDFLALLSHELRAPMSTILGWARVLRRGPVDRETTAKALESIERNVRAQATLIDELLDFSRARSGRLELEVGTVELAPLIAAVVEAVRAAASAKAIGLDLSLDPRAGPIAGDPARLQQIVSAIASHAVAVTPRGGSVRLALESRGSVNEIKVSDTGPRIDPDHLSHVFEPLRRTDTPRAGQQRNLGLGLAIARHLTELHGGTIRAESPGPGGGATFTLTFPVLGNGALRAARTEADESRASTGGRPPPEAPGPLSSSRA
jgi:signal transduction histidine kinase